MHKSQMLKYPATRHRTMAVSADRTRIAISHGAVDLNRATPAVYCSRYLDGSPFRRLGRIVRRVFA